MASNSSRLLLITILSLTLLFNISAAQSEGKPVGDWKPIKDPNDPKVVEIGKFAVSEHNKISKESLTFQKVVKGHFQDFTGTNYRLVIAATSNANPNSDYYVAVVWSKPFEHFRQLKSFYKMVKN